MADKKNPAGGNGGASKESVSQGIALIGAFAIPADVDVVHVLEEGSEAYLDDLNRAGYWSVALPCSWAEFAADPKPVAGDHSYRVICRERDRDVAMDAGFALGQAAGDVWKVEVRPASGDRIPADSQVNGRAPTVPGSVSPVFVGVPEVSTSSRAWGSIDLTDVLAGSLTVPTPTMWRRDDGLALLYPGRTHSVHGESESGKSLLMQAEAAAVLNAGGRVLYLDYEDTAPGVVGRLVAFGASKEAIAARFDYRNPDGDPKSIAERPMFREILRREYDLVVIDGVTVSLGTMGLGSNSNDEVAHWQRVIPDAIARATGAAVVVIDHVTKSTEGRGRFAVGSYQKMAGLTGASFYVDVIDVIGPGREGTLQVLVGKDRPGGIRPHLGPAGKDRLQVAAEAIVDSTGDIGTVTLVVAKGEPAHTADVPREYERITEFGLSDGQQVFVIASVYCTADGLTETALRNLWHDMRGFRRKADTQDWKAAWKEARDSGAMDRIRSENGSTKQFRPSTSHEWAKFSDVQEAVKDLDTFRRSSRPRELRPRRVDEDESDNGD